MLNVLDLYLFRRYCCKSITCSSLAGNGNCSGVGGGGSRLGQSQTSVSTEEIGSRFEESSRFVDKLALFMVSPMFGNDFVIMPSAVHASLLRNILSELSVRPYVDKMWGTLPSTDSS